MRIRTFSAIEPGFSFYRDLLPHLASVGHHVQIVISDANYRDHGGSFSAAMKERGVSVDLVRLGGTTAGRGSRRVWLYARYIASAVRRSLFQKSVDANLFLTQPPFFFLWGLVLKILRGQRYVLVLMDLYPDVITESGMASRRAPHIRLAAWLARLGYRHADALVAIGRCTRDRMVRAGVRPEGPPLLGRPSTQLLFSVIPLAHEVLLEGKASPVLA
jgi:hypothetical protein